MMLTSGFGEPVKRSQPICNKSSDVFDLNPVGKFLKTDLFAYSLDNTFIPMSRTIEEVLAQDPDCGCSVTLTFELTTF